MASVATTHLPLPSGVPYNVRLANVVDDQEDILRLCRESGLHCTAERYKWNYLDNPLRSTWSAVAVNFVHQRVVGTTALFPRSLLLNGARLRAAVAGDFAVEPGHRGLYAALALQKAATAACKAGEFDILYGFPNKAARPVQLRAGYQAIGQMISGMRLLRTRTALEKRGRGLWCPWVADAFDGVLGLLSRDFRTTARGEYAYSCLAAYDERFDAFWHKMLPRFRVVVERTSPYFNWRFRQCPSKQYSLFAAVHTKTAEVGGYIVWWTNDGKTHIYDIMSCDAAFDGLLAAFIALQRKQNTYCITLSYFGDHELIRRLCKFGFFFRLSQAKVLVHFTPALQASAQLCNPDNWYLLDGDSDA